MALLARAENALVKAGKRVGGTGETLWNSVNGKSMVPERWTSQILLDTSQVSSGPEAGITAMRHFSQRHRVPNVNVFTKHIVLLEIDDVGSSMVVVDLTEGQYESYSSYVGEYAARLNLLTQRGFVYTVTEQKTKLRIDVVGSTNANPRVQMRWVDATDPGLGAAPGMSGFIWNENFPVSGGANPLVSPAPISLSCFNYVNVVTDGWSNSYDTRTLGFGSIIQHIPVDVSYGQMIKYQHDVEGEFIVKKFWVPNRQVRLVTTFSNSPIERLVPTFEHWQLFFFSKAFSTRPPGDHIQNAAIPVQVELTPTTKKSALQNVEKRQRELATTSMKSISRDRRRR